MSTRWFVEFETIDPKNPKKTWKVGVPEQHFRQLQHHGHEAPLARLLLVHEVLGEELTLLYEGWDRPGKDDKCFVYAGFPKREFKSRTIETNPPPGKIFLVFVLRDGTIDHWTWRECRVDDDGITVPSEIKGKLIWSQNQS